MRTSLCESGLARALAALAIAAALSLSAAPARAQLIVPCELPNTVAEDYFRALTIIVGDTVFPLGNEAVCDKLRKTAVAGCRKAVSASVKCVEQVFKSYASGTKTVCATFGAAKNACNEEFALVFAVTGDLDEAAEAAADDCEERGDEYRDGCLSGLP